MSGFRSISPKMRSVTRSFAVAVLPDVGEFAVTVAARLDDAARASMNGAFRPRSRKLVGTSFHAGRVLR